MALVALASGTILTQISDRLGLVNGFNSDETHTEGVVWLELYTVLHE